MVLRAKVRGRVGRRPSKFEDGADRWVCAGPVPPLPGGSSQASREMNEAAVAEW